MAAKKTANGKKTTEKSSLPAGFKPLRQRLDGFFAREKGNSITGELRGSFTMKGGKFGPKQVYRIAITDGETQIEDGEMVGEGAIVGVDGTGYVKALGDVEAGTIVHLVYKGKSGTAKEDPHVFEIGVAE